LGTSKQSKGGEEKQATSLTHLTLHEQSTTPDKQYGKVLVLSGVIEQINLTKKWAICEQGQQCLSPSGI
jgi:hypothetical protein